MKKLMTLLLAFTTIVTLVSCSSKSDTGEIEVADEIITSNEVETNETKEEQENESSSRERSELLPETYQFPGPEIYIDIPLYNGIEKGFTRIYKDGETKYVTFNCFRNDVAADAKEAFEVSYPMFKNNVKSWHRINGETFTSTELVEINGISAQKVIGTVEYGALDKYDCYLYGYGFIFEEVPCAIIGVVSDLDQPQEEIDELTAIVDAMMESVRNEP